MGKRQRCPLCYSYTEEIRPILNAGKGYTQCCEKCEQVANLIVEDFPYNRDWFKSDISLANLVHHKYWQMPIPLDNRIIFDEDAKAFLVNTYQVLSNELIEELRLFSTLESLIYLGRFYDHISKLLRNPKDLATFVESSKSPSEGFLVQRLHHLRELVLLLQRFVISAGLHNGRQSPDLEKFLDLIALVDNIDYVASCEDGLYYLNEWKGVLVAKQTLCPINADLDIDKIIRSDDLTDLLTSVNNERVEGSKRLSTYFDEFYQHVFELDDALEESVGFSATEIYKAELFLSDFANKYNGTFVATIDEFYSLLVKGLGQVKPRNLQSLAIYLLFQFQGANSVPKPYETSRFYSPIYHVPVDRYSIVIINSNILDHARTALFHDLTYGVHPFILENRKCSRAYDQLKQKYITAPFEEDVATLFKSSGWNVLLNVQGGQSIANRVVTIVPKTVGEIDILATDPQGNIIFVGDCKYLYEYGATAKEIKTLQQKFTDPQKGYFTQIIRKYEWLLTELDAIKTLLGLTQKSEDILVIPLIVTRNKVAIQNSNNILLVSFHELQTYLRAGNYHALITNKFKQGIEKE